MKQNSNKNKVVKKQYLSNTKLVRIERSYRHEYAKATDEYLSTELAKYRHLIIIVESNRSKIEIDKK